MKSDAITELQADGRVWFRRALSEPQLQALDRACEMGAKPGTRLRAEAAIVEALHPVSEIARGLMAEARPVRLVAFNKSEGLNWSLPWHQDRVIAVRERAEAPGFSNWTRKGGVWHVEPPIGVMESMIFARVHLDAAAHDGGCLELALGSHQMGRVTDSNAERAASGLARELCVAERGDVLFARALTLHRSRASQRAEARRALRIDYSAEALPPSLEWEFQS